MRYFAQAGFSLIETSIAAAIAAVAIGALLFSMSAFGRYGSHQIGPNRQAATALAERTLRIAADAWKYGTPGNAPAGSSAAANATVSTTVQPIDAQSARLTVSVQYTPDPGHADSGSVSASGIVQQQAPAPGAQITRPGLVPMPSGAP